MTRYGSSDSRVTSESEEDTKSSSWECPDTSKSSDGSSSGSDSAASASIAEPTPRRLLKNVRPPYLKCVTLPKVGKNLCDEHICLLMTQPPSIRSRYTQYFDGRGRVRQGWLPLLLGRGPAGNYYLPKDIIRAVLGSKKIRRMADSHPDLLLPDSFRQQQLLKRYWKAPEVWRARTPSAPMKSEVCVESLPVSGEERPLSSVLVPTGTSRAKISRPLYSSGVEMRPPQSAVPQMRSMLSESSSSAVPTGEHENLTYSVPTQETGGLFVDHTHLVTCGPAGGYPSPSSQDPNSEVQGSVSKVGPGSTWPNSLLEGGVFQTNGPQSHCQCPHGPPSGMPYNSVHGLAPPFLEILQSFPPFASHAPVEAPVVMMREYVEALFFVYPKIEKLQC
ncbi:hypothetical protein N7468_006824 [Penicillium chermesinum]|uniref:Uncharacterized protein n=1 Tax=Penicillium chermesinum TaxID=63820 RepID=A0A9W9NT27_9EURO|nr:uncharacterized protein N7468_006824 [Penicillium chermesinum]KAJ5225599.1 hypothetical protein N7468_006824 [Penicillium chermesinum]